MKKIILSFFFMFVLVPVASAQLQLVQLDDGLKYKDQIVGKGEEALSGKVVVVDYNGWLLKKNGNKGSKFDSSYDNAKKFEFRLGAGDVIKGWDMGIVGMRVGGTRELRIPSDLAYGKESMGKRIPANSDLIFEVKLLGVK